MRVQRSRVPPRSGAVPLVEVVEEGIGGRGEELFTDRTDSLETVNLVDHPLYGARLATLRAHLMKLPLA